MTDPVSTTEPTATEADVDALSAETHSDAAADSATSAEGAVPELEPGLGVVNLARVQSVITGMGFRVIVEDNQLWGWWDGRYFDFRYFEEAGVLQVRAIWNGQPSIEHLTTLVEASQAYNAQMFFPKTFVIQAEQQLLAMTELNVPFLLGATDGQIRTVIEAGIGTSEHFFQYLDQQVPEAAVTLGETDAAAPPPALAGLVADTAEAPFPRA
jgi:hypothetical protein